MALILFKWLMGLLLLLVQPEVVHPFYVSVTEIEYVTAAQRVEVSCKLYTDDFEKALRKKYKRTIDLISENNKAAMKPLVCAYITERLLVKTDVKYNLSCIDYEIDQDAVMVYLQAEKVKPAKEFIVENTILYDYQEGQTNIIHYIRNGKRTSTKLLHPSNTARFEF